MRQLIIKIGFGYLILEVGLVVIPILIDKVFSINVSLAIFQYSLIWFFISFLVGLIIFSVSTFYNLKNKSKGRYRLPMMIGIIIIMFPFILTYFVGVGLH